MAGRRVERLNEQFRRELTEVVRGEARDPRVAEVTITAVRVAPDLTFARVFIAPRPAPASNAEALAGLRAAVPFLRHALGTRLQVRRIPELRFELDESLARGQRIESLLHDVAAAGGRETPESPGGAERAEPGSALEPGSGDADVADPASPSDPGDDDAA